MSSVSYLDAPAVALTLEADLERFDSFDFVVVPDGAASAVAAVVAVAEGVVVGAVDCGSAESFGPCFVPRSAELPEWAGDCVRFEEFERSFAEDGPDWAPSSDTG